MKKFSTLLNEAKNLHMTHAEDAVIDGGVMGTRNVINHLRDIRDMLGGTSKSSVNISVKWDGAPAVFAGTDPSDGKFFVAKKGIFNKNPKVYKTHADIDADTSGELAIKLKLALDEFSKLGIKGVVQGDFLYERSDIKEDTIDGEPHITFHPNTIVYAVPKSSALAKEILGSKVGVVWHTVYRGDSFETMSASFGEEIASGLKKVKSCWSVDAVFRDQSGTANMTKAETDAVTLALSNAGKLFRMVPKKTLDDVANNEAINQRLNVYINSKVREGQRVGKPKAFVKGFEKYMNTYFDKEIAEKKSPKGKATWQGKKDVAMKFFKTNKSKDLENMFTMYNHIVDAKHLIVKKLNMVGGLRTLLKTSKGYEVTGQEGFVAIDRYGKNALKLVDRLEFSKANFSDKYIKGWTK
ncbi:MAG: hypothetical protein HOM88_04285 [Hellea sp.]|nr:hypothetical protein [Hellea sp.]